MYLYLVTILFTSGLSRTIEEDQSASLSYNNNGQPANLSCSLPNGGNGSCVSVFKCDELFDIYRKPADELTLTEEELLMDAYCGQKQGAPYVCCNPSNTPITAAKITKRKSSGENIRCGSTVVETKPKITEGERSRLGAWPWLAAIYSVYSTNTAVPYRLEGAGALISKEWVLTSDFIGVQEYAKLRVRLGDLDIIHKVDDKASPIDVDVAESIQHSSRLSIILLRLHKPVEFSDYIRPICVHAGEKYLADKYYETLKPVVAGWFYEEPDAESNHLLESQINVIPSSKCNEKYKLLNRLAVPIDKTRMCGSSTTKTICVGERGGPLMFREGDIWYLGGVSVRGFECSNYPAIYIKVAMFTEWINNVTKLNL